MTTVSVTDFALHIQNYLDQVMQDEKITFTPSATTRCFLFFNPWSNTIT
jgi:hypothetical protein